VAGVAAELLARWLAGNPGVRLRLLGVVLTELAPAAQLALFDEPPQAEAPAPGPPAGGARAALRPGTPIE